VISGTFGHDIFIAYRQQTARMYAKALHDALEKRGLIVFLDEADEDVGGRIEQFKSIAARARTLVVVVTKDVYGSTYVRQEVESYRDKRMHGWRRPFSRMIPINVEQALSTPPPGDQVWRDLSTNVFVSESAGAVTCGTPAKEVVDRVARAGRFVRASGLFALLATTVALIIGTVLAFGGNRLRVLRDELAGTRTQVTTATKEKERLETTNGRLNDDNARLDQQARALKTTIDSLQETQSKLKFKVGQLSTAESAAKLRGRALSELERDPVIAYRLAERAEALASAPANREAMRTAISSAGLVYSRAFNGCTVDDAAGSTLLLRCTPTGGAAASLSRVEVASGSPHRLSIRPGRAAWLVPLKDSWRTLVLDDWKDKLRFQLFEPDGQPVGSPVFGRYLTPNDPRCSTMRIPLHLSTDSGST